MDGAQSLIRNGLAQNDIDMAHHRLLNLDTSNLPPFGIPPTIHPNPNQWLHDWDSTTQEWTVSQPSFEALSDNLTAIQQAAITQLGTIYTGVWEATPISFAFLPTLDSIRAPEANLNLASHRITNLADPINPNDAVNVNFLDSLVQGLNPKQSVRVASVGNLVRKDLITVDGVVLVPGDRVLVKNQTSVPQNGIYVAQVGDWVRATDCDHGSGDPGFTLHNSINGAYCTVLAGTVNANTGWVQNSDVVNIDADNVTFVAFSVQQSVLAGAGLDKTGNTIFAVGTANRISVGTGIDIANTYVGQASITTLGTITTGTWNANVIPPSSGGTGVNNGLKTITLSSGSLILSTYGSPPINPTLTLRINDFTDISLPASGTLATLTGTETFTNKRITPRPNQIASNSKPAINTDTTDIFYITTLSENILSMTDNLVGNPTSGESLMLSIKDDGTSRSITWGTSWIASSDVPLPAATTAGQWMFMRFIWHGILSKWLLTQKLDKI